MCGIAGWSLSSEAAELVNTNKLAKNLLMEISSRGRDATGFAYWGHSTVQYAKLAEPAHDFNRTYGVPKVGIKTCVLHTRFATQGHQSNPLNNHPIIYKNLVGVHNGWVDNDNHIFKVYKAKRFAEVDSEAIWALLYEHAKKSDDPTEAMQVLQGTAAVAWLDTEQRDVLHLSRIMGSPVSVARLTDGMGFVFASTDYLLKQALKDTRVQNHTLLDHVDGKLIELEEGQYLEFENGVPRKAQVFDPPLSYARFSTPYSYTTPAHQPSPSPSVVKINDKYPKAYAVFDRETGELEKVVDDANGAEYASWDDYLDTLKVTKQVDPNATVDDLKHDDDEDNSFNQSTYWGETYSPSDPSNGLLPVCLFNGQQAIPKMSAEDMNYYYETRMDEAENAEITSAEFFEMLADITPGDYVTTDFSQEWYGAQVMATPNSFPDGTWYLRLFYQGEFIFIRRTTDRVFRYNNEDPNAD